MSCTLDDARRYIFEEDDLGVRHPAVLYAFGEKTRVLVVHDTQENHLHTCVAASEELGGRVVVAGHDSFFTDGTPFGRRAASWAAHGKPNPVVGSFDTCKTNLENYDVLTWYMQLSCGRAIDPTDQELDALVNFVRRGGGVIVATCMWGALQSWGGPAAFPKLAMVRFAMMAGIGFTYSCMWPPLTTDPKLTRKNELFFAAEREWFGLSFEEFLSRGPPEKRRSICDRTLQQLAAKDADAFQEPSEGMGVAKTATVRARAVMLKYGYGSTHPKAFPGFVPDTAPRLSNCTMEFAPMPNPDDHRWMSTGLYVPKAEDITIEVLGDAVEWQWRVGCHKDDLTGRDSWKRWPVITTTGPLAPGVQTIRSEFGGLLYLERVEKSTAIKVRVSGCVAALVDFKDGRSTGLDESQLPPWGELEGRFCTLILSTKTLLSIPHEKCRRIAEYWDQVVMGHYQLSQREHVLCQRMAFDVQISNGLLHTGYPLMGILCHQEDATNLDVLEKTGSWGLYHELGHNFQRPVWTPTGTGEVTVNLFTLYSSELVCGYSWEKQPLFYDMVTKIIPEFAAKGYPFATWKEDPGIALFTYMEVVRAFGWQPLMRVFSQYEDDIKAKIGEDWSDEKRYSEWVVRYSGVVKRNLEPFFRLWNWPLLPDTAPRTQQWPPWTPDPLPAASSLVKPPPPADKKTAALPAWSVMCPGCSPSIAAATAAFCKHITGKVTDLSGALASEIVVKGPNARGILRNGDEPPKFLAAISDAMGGRIAVFGHDALTVTATGGMGICRRAVMEWLTNGRASASVGTVDTAGRLKDFDVIVWTGQVPSAERMLELRDFVSKGGALLIAVCMWGFAGFHDCAGEKDVNAPHNVFLRETGIHMRAVALYGEFTVPPL